MVEKLFKFNLLLGFYGAPGGPYGTHIDYPYKINFINFYQGDFYGFLLLLKFLDIQIRQKVYLFIRHFSFKAINLQKLTINVT